MALVTSCDGLSEEITEYDNESTVRITDEIIIPDEPEQENYMDLVAFTEYSNYVVTDAKKVYGINGSSLEEISLVDSDDVSYSFTDFFTSDDIVYFSVTTSETVDEVTTDTVSYFQQESSTITELDELPDKADSERVELDPDDPDTESGDFKIESGTSGDVECSFVYRGTSMTGYLLVDGYSVTDDGMWFSVSETYSIRLKGVYFYPDSGNIASELDSGRIW